VPAGVVRPKGLGYDDGVASYALMAPLWCAVPALKTVARVCASVTPCRRAGMYIEYPSRRRSGAL